MLPFFGQSRKYARKSSSRTYSFEVIELEPRVMPTVFRPTFVRFDGGSGIVPDTGSANPSGTTPAQMRTAYGVNLAAFGSVVGDGTGQTIAIIDAYNQPNIASDLAAFDSYYGLPAPASFTQVNQTGGAGLPSADSVGGWGVETTLDVEWAHVIAPNASILLVEANSASDTDLYAAVDEARNYSGVSAVSMSWSGDESSGDSSNNSHFTTPAGHIGVTFVASSGDSGKYSDTGSGSTIVQYPAASPNVVAIGGTTLNFGAGGSYSSESGWGNGTNSFNAGGSGGGISLYASQPSYQTGIVTQSTTHRTIPDVALDADPNTGVPIYDTYDNTPSTPWGQYGGTSLAAPMWAGVIAIANQGRVQYGLGTLDGPTGTLPKLYSLPASDFHDITTGNNGYAAGVGYDLVTGRGSPVVNLVVNDLVGNTPTVGSLAVNPTAVVSGATVTLTASNVVETGGAATITGVNFYRESNGTSGLQISSDTFVGAGTQSGTTWTLANVATTGLAAGSYTYYAVATDSGSLVSAPASAALTVTSTPIPFINNFAVSPNSVVTGVPVTLTASNVFETGGTAVVTGVHFYRETNGIGGLQIGSDTLVGAATANGTVWTLANVSTTGLAAGTYTFFAVATDSSSLSSAAVSASLTITPPGPILAWNVTGQINFGTQGLPATTVAAGITNSLGLTRGSGVTTSGSSTSNAWGGKHWASTSATGISSNEFASFGFTVAIRDVVSLTSIDMNYRRSSTGPANGYWQYQINGGAWTLIGNFANEFSTSLASGGAIPEISLTGISALQNLTAGTSVKIRVVPYGASSTTASWFVYDRTGVDLAINGTITPVLAPTTTLITSHSPSPATTAQAVAFNIGVSGGVPDGESVTLKDASNNNAVVGAGTLGGGSASITVAAGTLSAGTHNLFAVYSGDGTFAASQSAQVSQSVLAPTTITLIDNGPNPSASGQDVGFTATVSGGDSISFESVSIEDASNANAIVASPTLVHGTVTFTINSLSVGTHSLFVVYGGDSTHVGSNDSQAPVVQVVVSAGPAPAVASVVINGGAPAYIDSNNTAVSLAGQNSIVEQILVTFNEPVTLDPGAFSIINDAAAVTVLGGLATPNTADVTAITTPVADSGGTQFLVTFSGPGTTAIPGTGSAGAFIQDGVYLLNTDGSKVHANSQTAADNNTGFWVLYGSLASDNLISPTFGDGNSEILVDTPDSALFKNTFGSDSTGVAGLPIYNVGLDSNLDGNVDTPDAARFKNNFGTDWMF